ncbi:hypothetical protein Franean1_6907 [Parafrankia sp. EAN1pec]|nr:hypothetical protein Franean1_6907 [Frankia sp. EAN1pec]
MFIEPIQKSVRGVLAFPAANPASTAPPRKDLLYIIELAGTLNGMLDRIQRSLVERDRALDSQRMFTANAAHELRTPLTRPCAPPST